MIKLRLLHSKLLVKTKERDTAFHLNECVLLCLLHHAYRNVSNNNKTKTNIDHK